MYMGYVVLQPHPHALTRPALDMASAMRCRASGDFPALALLAVLVPTT